MDIKINIKTEIEKCRYIKQKITVEIADLIKPLFEQICDLQENQFVKALLDLGWQPPQVKEDADGDKKK